MKTRIAMLGLWLAATLGLPAQTFQVLYHFNFSDSMAPFPQGQLLLSGTNLYGTTEGGGDYQDGSIYRISTNGMDFKTIRSFTAMNETAFTNADGAMPMAGLVLWSNQLFGTTYEGGSGTRGTVFGVNTDGTGFAVLNNFNGANGKAPYVGLTLADGVLYGATAAGGISNKGAIFSVNPDGSNFLLVKSFLPTEGILLMGRLATDGQTLYGTTYEGGVSNRGTIYSLGTNGGGFQVLKTFAAGDGTQPRYSMVLAGNTLYGVTDGNSINSNSIVFRMNTDGTGYAVIKRFSEPDPVTSTNRDGSYICGGMVMWNGILYGTTRWGGDYANGVIFKVNPDGSGFAVLKHFAAATGINSGLDASLNPDGMYPLGDLMVANGVLYGTTQYGGNYGAGTLFSLTIPPTPPLQATNCGYGPVLCWTDDGLNRTLQTTTDLTSGNWTNVSSLNWTNSSTVPQQIGLCVTNCINAPAAFFRLW